MQGSDYSGSLYVEISRDLLRPFDIMEETYPHPGETHFYLRMLMPGDVELIDPDPWMINWMLGRGFSYNPNIPTPLEHSPEPSTLLLLGTSMVIVGWKIKKYYSSV